MANLPSKHPKIAMQLVDRSLAPLITSARTQQQAKALSTVSQTALLSHEAALRLGLGQPQRIMVEHTTRSSSAASSSSSGGPVLLHSILNPAAALAADAQQQQQQEKEKKRLTEVPAAATPTAVAAALGQATGGDLQRAAPVDPDPEPDVAEVLANAPPMLLSTVVAPGADLALEARRAAARLERIGSEVQARWASTQQQVASANGTS